MLPERQAEIYRSSTCVVRVWRPAPTVMVTQVEGLLNDGGARAIEQALWRQVASDGRVLAFHDWEALDDYDLTARALLTSAAARVARQIEEAHFLVRARSVVFGVKMANVIVKKFTVHGHRERFEKMLEEALAARRALN